MYKAKHSKFKNTGILFELLTRQVTSDILSGKDESAAKDLLFKYFAESKELGKEWQLYNFILTEKANLNQVESCVSLCLRRLEKLDEKKLMRDKYELIKEIRIAYPLDEMLKTPLKNYKVLASIYKIFENHMSTSCKFDLDEIFDAKNCLVEHLTGQKNIVKEAQSADEIFLSKFKTESEDIRILSYKLMVESLNDKYKGLEENQKRLLREYINNVSNSTSLFNLIVSEISKIKQSLTEAVNKIDSEVIKIKINETIKQIDSCSPTKPSAIKDNHICVLLMAYKLISEINSKL